jgi:hypothetical protein
MHLCTPFERVWRKKINGEQKHAMAYRRRKRQQPDRRQMPPDGYLYYYGELMPIEEVEKISRRRIGRHDRLSRRRRDLGNL